LQFAVNAELALVEREIAECERTNGIIGVISPNNRFVSFRFVSLPLSSMFDRPITFERNFVDPGKQSSRRKGRPSFAAPRRVPRN